MHVSLRKNVHYQFCNDGVEIDHSIWRLKINEALLQHSKAMPLFDGSTHSILFDPDDKVLRLLRGQGCLSAPVKNLYDSEAVLEIFNAVSLDWYREYYEHSLWSRLRSGVSSRNQLVAWLIHNYHVSVNAGITHARIASLGAQEMCFRRVLAR